MLIFAIFGVLLLGVLVILIANSRKHSSARSWLIAVITASLALVISFTLRLYLPSEITLTTWHKGTVFEVPLGLSIGYRTWPYIVAVLSMCVAVLLTDTTRTDETIRSDSWVRVVSVTGLNLIAILAANPLTMAIAWMLIDLFEVLSLLRLSRASQLGSRITTAFGIRILSTFMLIIAASSNWLGDQSQVSYVQAANTSIYFLIAAGLRLGVLPINLPFLDSPELKRGSGILFRLMPAASALVLIAHLPDQFLIFETNLVAVVQVLTLIAAFYSAIMWVTRSESYEAQPYWVVALSSFAIQSALNGHPEASRAWGLGLLLSGSLLFLYNPPIRRIRFLPLLGLLGFIGLPYTLGASGWEGLLPGQFNFTWVVMILTHALLVAGYIRFIMKSDSSVTGVEKFARITFPLGLVILIQTILVLTWVGWPEVLTIGNLWGSLGSLAIVVSAVVISWRMGWRLPDTNLSEKLPFYRLGLVVMNFLRKFMSFAWLWSFSERVYGWVGDLGGFLHQILEGDGGVLWSLVFLVIVTIIFISVGTP